MSEPYPNEHLALRCGETYEIRDVIGSRSVEIHDTDPLTLVRRAPHLPDRTMRFVNAEEQWRWVNAYLSAGVRCAGATITSRQHHVVYDWSSAAAHPNNPLQFVSDTRDVFLENALHDDAERYCDTYRYARDASCDFLSALRIGQLLDEDGVCDFYTVSHDEHDRPMSHAVCERCDNFACVCDPPREVEPDQGGHVFGGPR